MSSQWNIPYCDCAVELCSQLVAPMKFSEWCWQLTTLVLLKFYLNKATFTMNNNTPKIKLIRSPPIR